MAPSSAKSKPQADNTLDDLQEPISAIFEQAQSSLANHKKNCVALYKIQTKAAGVRQPTKTKTTKDKGKNGVAPGEILVAEKAFQDVFIDMLARVLVVKKGPATADRIVKYVGAFVKFMNEKVIEAKSKTASSSSASTGNGQVIEEDEDTPTSRFVSHLLTWLLQGFVAKNKVVRYRCIQIVAEMISHLGEIDEDTYNDLREALTDRLNDKETIIRTHAVIALSRLVGSDEVEDGEQTILQTLLEAISTDPAAEVRRAALLHVPLAPATVDAVLTRTRDIDPVTRKLVYSGVLQPKLAHPRHLTIAQREQIVKDGLGDREPAVRVAAGKLVTSWFDVVLAGSKEAEESHFTWEGDDGGVMKGLISFLGLFDVIGPGEAVAVDAVLSIFTTRPDVVDVFVFPDAYWKELTPESAVLARVFVEQCVSTKNEGRLESASLPVVTAFAFHVQEAYNGLLAVLEEIETAKLLRAGLEEEENDELEEELAKREVVMSELLRMALKLDYADEIGRRKVFSVVKDMLAHPQLPPGLIERCLDVLKKIMPSERDLIRVIVEIVVELREGEEDAENAEEPPIDDNQSDVSQATIKRDKSVRRKDRQDMSPEERVQADLTDIRCLMLCIAMLERVNGTFEDNSTLEGILGDLIIPSVKRKELAMREKALVSLGLCCLIAKNMALSSFQLFLSQAQNAPSELKVQVLKIIMDLLIMYDQEFFGRSEETVKQLVDFLLQILEAEESPEAQAILVTGLCKLLLAGIITEPKVLTCLALLYISPNTVDNQELRQCLSYFFPVYSYSSRESQIRMSSIFMSTFDLALRMHEDLDEDQEMISLHQFGLLMVDWTNPQKAAQIEVEGPKDQASHVNVAVEILVALYDSDRTVDQQKTLCQLLGQVQIEPGLDNRSIHKLNILLSYHEEQTPFDNSAVEKIFDRFKDRFSKMFEKEIDGINPQDFIDDEFRDIYQRIGVDVPEEGDDGRIRARAKGKRKARQRDENDEEEEEDDEEDSKEQEKDEQHTEDEAGTEVEESEKSKAGDETEQEVRERSDESPSPPPPPKRGKQATRKSTKKPKVTTRSRKSVTQEGSEDDYDSDEENIPPPVTVTPKKKGVKRVHTPGSGAVNSPANRKRTRVKAPLKVAVEETTPADSDSEGPSSPTPRKPTRRTRSRTIKGRTKKAKEPTPEPSEQDEDNEDADEVANALETQEPPMSPLTPPPDAYSDDFGGY
ncbi:nuclear condensing complex subunit [Gymnopilus junonius]|uniref:Nuclear condensing complex subunit n=1 Tax=Gymnopilus junonius TaxID=109634 RepID=A0A9P5TFQ6_GYMJU|nr:nuclear condensing complex subunit [Gymnopilus junonius]